MTARCLTGLESFHQHEHTHVTHYLRHGEEWAHLTANHDHEHNHAP